MYAMYRFPIDFDLCRPLKQKCPIDVHAQTPRSSSNAKRREKKNKKQNGVSVKQEKKAKAKDKRAAASHLNPGWGEPRAGIR